MFYKKQCSTCKTIFYCEGDLCSIPTEGYDICHCVYCTKNDSWAKCKKHEVSTELLEKIALEEL